MKSSPLHAPRLFSFGLVVLCFLGLTISTSAFAARPEDPKAIGKATELNMKALELYSDGDFNKARQLLKQALDLCVSAGLDKHPIAARTHIHMGVVMVGGLKQHDLALQQFRKAIEIQPDIQVTHNVATPEVLAAFKEATDTPDTTPAPSGEGAAPAGADEAPAAQGGGGEETSSAAPATGIIHTPVVRAKAGAPILITAKMGVNVTGFQKVVLGFKGAGEDDFTTKDMARVAGKFASQIPASATKGKTVSYYIEAQDSEGTVLASAGGESRPLSVALGAGKKCPEGDDSCEEGEGGGGAGGPPIFVALMGGFGFGYATGHADLTSVNQVKPGFAPSSLLHVAPEVGYFIKPDLRLSLQARVQIVTGPTPLDMNGIHQPAKLGFAALARGSWFFGEGPLQPYVSAALGGGQIRHVVVFTGANKLCGPNGDKTCVDTVTPGPLLFGGGAGLTYALSETFGLVAEANALLGLPKLTFHIDLNGGLALRF